MSGILIRPAIVADAPLLPDIEISAGEAFRGVPGLEWIADDDVMSAGIHEVYIEEGTVWVAEKAGKIIGFITSREEFDDRQLHILEIAVTSENQGKGIGRRLIDSAQEHASTQKLTAMTLITFRDLAFNEKFYLKYGFRTLKEGELNARLKQTLAGEIENGLPGERRCAMLLDI